MNSSSTARNEWIPDLVLIGRIVEEMIYFPTHTLGPVLGSPVSYGSVMAGRLGEKIGIVTTIGTDMPAELLKPFHDAHVDLSGMRIKEGNWTTLSHLIYDTKGNKEIRYPQQAPPICFADIPQAYHQAKIFYIATMNEDVPLDTIKELRRLKGLLAIDLGGYGGAHSRWHPNEEERKNPVKLAEFLSHFDIIRASIEDCAHVLGEARISSVEGEEDILRLFLSWGAQVGLITLGERGCVVGTKEKIVRVPPPKGAVIDTTGAGDSFSTAFLIGYMHTRDIEWSAQFSGATVIHIIERTGGVHADRFPTRPEVEKRLKENY
jgi:fructokinase